MPRSHADMIVHPVRLRLLATLARRQLTAHQLRVLLPDIPQATLYHHLGLLMQGGYLRVVSERQVRGTVERRYALADIAPTLTAADFANLAPDEHLRFFTLFVTTLIGEYTRYLQQHASTTPIDLLADRVAYRETPFYLSDAEFDEAQDALNHALLPFLGYEPAPQRRRRLLTIITFPDAEVSDIPPDAELSADTSST